MDADVRKLPPTHACGCHALSGFKNQFFVIATNWFWFSQLLRRCLTATNSDNAALLLMQHRYKWPVAHCTECSQPPVLLLSHTPKVTYSEAECLAVPHPSSGNW